jgi:hypothetical protein
MDVLDLKIWLPFDELMMERCDTLIVAQMCGWGESSGIAHEIKVFERARKPIFDLDPLTLKMAKRQNGDDYQIGLTDDEIQRIADRAELHRIALTGNGPSKFERFGT